MAYGLKYTGYFPDINNDIFTLEIYQLNYTGVTNSGLTSSGISFSSQPVIVEHADISNKFEPVRGSGISINLLATFEGQFRDLYTTDMKEYQFIFKDKNNIEIWHGYLNSELYSEPFDSIDNYDVSITGNDGLALLDRIYYLDDNDNKYSGITSQWVILTRILKKIGIYYNGLYVGLSTTSTHFDLDEDETIFHKTFCNEANWYNEDDESETCRKILEELLKPYGAFIIQDNGYLYITDYNNLLEPNYTYMKLYNATTTYNYQSTELILTGLDALGTTLKYASSNQQLNIINPINKQIVSYDKYLDDTIESLDCEEEFSTTGTTTTNGSTGYRWSETTYENSITINKYNDGRYIKLNGLDGNDTDLEEFYLQINNSGQTNNETSNYIVGGLSFDLVNKPYIINQSNKGYYLKLNLSVYPRSVDDLNNESETPLNIKRIHLYTNLTIGDKRWCNPLGQASAWYSPTSFYYNKYFNVNITNMNSYTWPISSDNFSYIADTWTELQKFNTINVYTNEGIKPELSITDYLIPLNAELSGEINFEIFGYSVFDYNITGGDSLTGCHELRIKDLEITIVDKDGNETSDDSIEYVGYVNKNIKDNGEEITLYQGTNTIFHPNSRSALLYSTGTTYKNMELWSKSGSTDTIENLLLRSIVSNYTTPTIQFICTTDKIQSVVGTYSNPWLYGKKFFISGCKIDYQNNTSNLTLLEGFKDHLTVQKNY